MEKREMLKKLFYVLEELREEDNKLYSVGIEIESIDKAGEGIETCIEIIVGMFDEIKINEHLKDMLSNYWFGHYLGHITDDELIDVLINWREVFEIK